MRLGFWILVLAVSFVLVGAIWQLSAPQLGDTSYEFVKPDG